MTVTVTLAIEDVLSEAIAKKVVSATNPDLIIDQVIGNQGFGYLKNKIRALNHAAHNGVVTIMVADLDDAECPARLREEWLKGEMHPNLVFRVAVREIEAWLLADHEGLADFLSIPRGRIPQVVDEIPNPKQLIVNLARRSRKSWLKKALVPSNGSSSSVGAEYNNCLLSFIRDDWSLHRARARSESLNRAFFALQRFRPS